MTLLKTARFNLRTLTKADATIRYLSWFNDKMSKQYIAYSSTSIDELSSYIESKNASTACLLLGIFHGNEHIGNIKYEPISYITGEATMGILIGDPQWRGKGVASEVITASASYLKKNHSTKVIILGVDTRNHSAIKSYEKLGFKTFKTKGQGIFMHWSLI